MEEKATLFDLNKRIRNSIEQNFPDSYWVIAEISELKINNSGHCYLELIEKDPNNDKIIARARATIWSYTFRMLKPYFETASGISLDKGIKILVKAKVTFHEQYGLSLNILDIDPGYTLGDMERKRQETLRQLEKDGVLEMNKQISFPTAPQRIALISSETAAGYRDFMNQLLSNTYGFTYYIKLFPAIMQGDEAIPSLIKALDKIYLHENFFDIVVIIRGGGSKSDLSCFDSYDLAYHITQFPLPVLTGIGHEQDISVADLAAHTKLKTPTAVAEFLIMQTYSLDQYLEELQTTAITMVNDCLQNKQEQIDDLSRKLARIGNNVLVINSRTLDQLSYSFEKRTNRFLQAKKDFLRYSQSAIKSFSGKYFIEKKHYLQIASKTINYMDPEQVLKRGYSLTYHNGIIIRNGAGLTRGDMITSKFERDEVNSKVEKVRR
ncbi:MAG: exodeoxyribonuclease VII large subunit, partial [Bacteroidales bacterium]|nr:exodeoxyribonuclease VII large subunit [Bacteroidales bacterium]